MPDVITKIEESFDFENMSYDQKAALYYVTNNLLGCICGCEVAKAGEGQPLPFESALIEVLLNGWENATTKATKEVIRGLNRRQGKISNAEVNRILKLYDEFLGTQFPNKVENPTSNLLTKSYKSGKREVGKRLKLKIAFDKFDKDATKWLADHHMFWIGNYNDRFISENIAKTVEQGIVDGLGRKEMGKQLKDFFKTYPGVSVKPNSYWQGLAANAINRSRTFGLIGGYEDAGIKSLQILAIIDERTSSICKELNGNIIPTASAIQQRDDMMAADNPEDVIDIAPWKTADDVKDLSVSEQIEEGVILPPFHFHCRTTVIEKQ